MSGLKHKLNRLEKDAQVGDDVTIVIWRYDQDDDDQVGYTITYPGGQVENGIGLSNIPEHLRGGDTQVINLVWGDEWPPGGSI